MREKEEHTHPSYGIIGFSRINCGGNVSFFGTDLPVDNYIELRIKPGELERDLTTDRYHPKSYGNHILKVRMTPIQFSELITSLNIGEGVPCTIEKINNIDVPQDENKMESRKEYVQRTFQQEMNQFVSRIVDRENQVKEILKKQTLNKSDKEVISNIIGGVKTELKSNLPFFLRCFQESMDKIVLEAKTEVEASLLQKITTLGLQALYDQNNKLLENNIDNKEV